MTDSLSHEASQAALWCKNNSALEIADVIERLALRIATLKGEVIRVQRMNVALADDLARQAAERVAAE